MKQTPPLLRIEGLRTLFWSMAGDKAAASRSRGLARAGNSARHWCNRRIARILTHQRRAVPARRVENPRIMLFMINQQQ
jgi:hypothetical protein